MITPFVWSVGCALGLILVTEYHVGPYWLAGRFPQPSTWLARLAIVEVTWTLIFLIVVC